MTGTISGTDYVGGLIGFTYGTKISTVVGYARGMVSGTGDYVGGLIGTNNNGSSVTGYWDLGTTSDGSTGIGISSTENIYYYTAASEDPGRVQNMFYDKDTDTDPGNKDTEDDQIFNAGDFPSIFELPKADGIWPKLEESFTVESRTITLPQATYDAQKDIENR